MYQIHIKAMVFYSNNFFLLFVEELLDPWKPYIYTGSIEHENAISSYHISLETPLQLETTFSTFPIPNRTYLRNYRNYLRNYRNDLRNYRNYLLNYRNYLLNYRNYLRNYRSYLLNYRNYLLN